jgi:hypothetical protein
MGASRLSNMVERFGFLELGCLILSTLVFQASTGIGGEINKIRQNGKNIFFSSVCNFCCHNMAKYNTGSP